MLGQSYNGWLRAQSESSTSKGMCPNTLEKWLAHLLGLLYPLLRETTMEPLVMRTIISQVVSQIETTRHLAIGMAQAEETK